MNPFTGRATTDAARPRVDAVNWGEYRACAGEDPDLFADDARRTAAKAVCVRCPVQSFCLQFALDTNIPHGVYGGLDEDERQELLGRKRLRARGRHGNPEPAWRQILRVPERREELLDLHAHGWPVGRIAWALHTNVQTINRVLRELEDQAALDAASEAVAA
ncbi:WhiB family transcriptional regulator [Streptomyces sp. NPDC048611]|uniref:WhiB family transcriptional regulator n=1 Tax=Streptomyces sp. NPDC048611 TaxID=3155635 RepID=UPI00342070EB